jgi:hypothetical protein
MAQNANMLKPITVTTNKSLASPVHESSININLEIVPTDDTSILYKISVFLSQNEEPYEFPRTVSEQRKRFDAADLIHQRN